MLFGLSNNPVSFQVYVNKILAKKLDIFVIIYLNNILIYIEEPGHGYANLFNDFLKIRGKKSFLLI